MLFRSKQGTQQFVYDIILQVSTVNSVQYNDIEGFSGREISDADKKAAADFLDSLDKEKDREIITEIYYISGGKIDLNDSDAAAGEEDMEILAKYIFFDVNGKKLSGTDSVKDNIREVAGWLRGKNNLMYENKHVYYLDGRAKDILRTQETADWWKEKGIIGKWVAGVFSVITSFWILSKIIKPRKAAGRLREKDAEKALPPEISAGKAPAGDKDKESAAEKEERLQEKKEKLQEIKKKFVNDYGYNANDVNTAFAKIYGIYMSSDGMYPADTQDKTDYKAI